jgi:uncharacterized protein with FMN-binding domain
MNSSKKNLIVTLSVLLAIAVIVAGAVLTKKKDSTDSSLATTSSDTSTTDIAEDTPATTETTTTADNNTASSGYKDGTYTATGRYATPEATESITVTVTLKDGIITDTSATASESTRDSKEFAGAFVANYKSQVVGKNIASLKLSRVSGSSLTPQGFNSAIAQIQTKAKV